ncbi:hypothetical protein H1164_01780 [Thermoactinomyces daqus]|uniref:Uncharacterized protein n=1 Tax=Thermoactinomyces daqus TaxID=1329516 RepID=A0A7W2AGG9_9BACL|nr:hypothetical protein [Thermoactinomyces daqus]MBA4541636.1 hypothetical protein [Thermoactinomyces daqus]
MIPFDPAHYSYHYQIYPYVPYCRLKELPHFRVPHSNPHRGRPPRPNPIFPRRPSRPIRPPRPIPPGNPPPFTPYPYWDLY